MSTTPGPGAGPRIILSEAWAARLAQARPDPDGRPEPVRILPRVPEPYAEGITSVADRAGAEAMLDFARQRRVSFAGIGCESRHDRPGVPIRNGRWWHDPTSVVPLLLAVVLAEFGDDGRAVLYRFVVDLRRPEVLGPTADLLRLPVPFVGHFLQAELFCFWKLGLPTPASIWDTWMAERAFLLGLFHARYRKETPEDEGELARLEEEAEADLEFTCTLVATCSRRGVPLALAAARERLRRSFLDHPEGSPFTAEQREYAAADAEAAARLYPIQVQEAVARNALDHLKAVEMPWAVTNAGMIRGGVRDDPRLREALATACDRHDATLSARLAELGLGNVNSHPELVKFFRAVGLLDAFREGAKYTFDDGHLEAAEGRHAAIPLIRAARKIRRLRSDRLLGGELVGADGRLHPDHRQLGTESGRNAMRDPNIGGIGRALRPLVVPDHPEGWGIGEVDLSQIEVMIAAAESRDPGLLAMVNGGDVYCAMARTYYADRLTAEDLALPDKEFSKRFGLFRDLMKVFTLAIIYNITSRGLARQLGITERRAAEERGEFMAMFPVLDRALRESSAYGAIRGYAQLCTGLRRRRARGGFPTPWEVNWLRNTPIQGSASVVFKVAGNRLYRRYQHYGARLLLPLHDAYVFESPLEHLDAVGRITGEVMAGAVQEYYPALDPRVVVNIEQPHCWSKDGKARSLALWLEDPELARAYLKS